MNIPTMQTYASLFVQVNTNIYIYIFVQVMGVAEKLPPFIHRLSRSSCWIGNGQCPNTLPQWYDPLARRVTRGDPQEMGLF